MIVYKQKKEIIEVPESAVCDKCGKKLNELDEIIEFRHQFGYGSKWDTDYIEFELCESCFFETIKDINYRIYTQDNTLVED